MTLEQAIKENPYDPNRGNLSAYCRYLRYNVDDFYTKTNDEVKTIFKDQTVRDMIKSKITMNECRLVMGLNPIDFPSSKDGGKQL